MLLDGLLDGGVNGEEGLLGTPVELLDVVTAEGVDHGSDGGSLSTTGEVKVEHTLDSSGLKTENERSGGLVERSVSRSLTVSGGLESDDVLGRLFSGTVSSDRTDTCVLSGGAGGSSASLDLNGGTVNDGVDCRLSRVRFLLDTERHRDDIGDVSFRSVNLDLDTERLAQQSHGFETFLVVGTTSSNEDSDLVSDQSLSVLFESLDDTLEGSSNVGEVGNTTTDDEDLALRVRSTSSDQVNDRLGVLVSLTLSGSTRVFTVVGEFMSESSCGDSVRVDDGGTTTCDHGPNSTFLVENSQFEGSTGGSIELLDVGLLFGQITTERSGPNHGWSSVGLDDTIRSSRGDGGVSCDSPFGTTNRVSGLIELGSHVEVVDGRGLAVNGIETDQRVNLEVSKVQVDVNTVQSDQEVAKDILLVGRNVLEQSRNDGLPRGELLADGDEKLEGFRIDIADFDTTFVGEQDPVTFSRRVDADVVLGVSRVREERLDDERVEGSSDLLDLDGFTGSRCDPVSSDFVLLVEAEQSSLSSSLDQLIGLTNKLVSENPVGKTLALLDGRG